MNEEFDCHNRKSIVPVKNQLKFCKYKYFKSGLISNAYNERIPPLNLICIFSIYLERISRRINMAYAMAKNTSVPATRAVTCGHTSIIL